MSASVAIPSAVDWWVVVPVKGGGAAKTRLVPPRGTDKRALARALALDTVAAAVDALGPGRVVVVTGSRWIAGALARTGCLVVADPGGGLNEAVRAGVARVPQEPSHVRGVAVLLGDLPAARSVDLRSALDAAAAHERAVVPDHHATGTVLLTAVQPQPVSPAFGPGSASRHTALGHRLLPLDLPRLRTDVDDSADLAAVVALGVGPRTAAALGLRAEYVGGVQATVASYDDGHGRVVLDDGTRLPFSPAALRGSGIRLLHPGQRVSVHAEGGVVQRLWLPGLGEAPG